MAANYIVTNTRFKPFTYDELLKPVLRATEEHRNLEEQYANLATSANAPLGMLNEVLDSESYKRNSDYLQDLENLADVLAKEGISSSSRRSALQMKQRYAGEILPIEQAIKRRQELVDQQREALLKDDTSMFDTDASLLSVDALVNTPQYTYKALSGAALTKRVHDIVSSLAREGSDIPSEVKSILGDQYYELKRTGKFTHKDLEDALEANTTNEKAKLLRSIINKAVASTGVNDWGNPNISEKARDYAYLGAYNAIGKDDYQILQNRDFQPSGNNTTSPPPSKPSLFAPRLISGGEGKVREDIKVFLDGLAPSSNPRGYMTNRTIKADEKWKKLAEDYISISQKLTEKDWEILADPTLPSRANLIWGSLPENVKEFLEVSGKMNSIESQSYKEVENLLKEFEHLGGDPYTALSTGKALAVAQAKQEISNYPLNSKASEYEDIRKGMLNIFGAMTEEDIENGAQGLMDSKGKFLSKKDLDDIAENPDKIAIRVTGGKDPHLAFMYNNEDYKFVGIPAITDFDDTIRETNEYLMDFSKDITTKVNEISDDTYRDIMTKGAVNIPLYGLQSTPYPSPKNPKYESIVLHNASNNDYIKILLKNNHVIGVSSLSDELYNDGQLRDLKFREMATDALMNTFDLFSQKYRK